MCYCNSKKLYAEEYEDSFYKCLNGSVVESLSCKRAPLSMFNCDKSPHKKIFMQNLELCAIGYPPEIESIDYDEIIENPLYFYKSFVARNVPCIIKNAVNDWKALENWEDPNYLAEILGEKEITVDMVPDGFADSIKGRHFIEPLQEKMRMKDFLSLRENHGENMVPYIQKQNDNLPSEFERLFDGEINLEIEKFFTKNYFSTPPDATNFWMGDSRSVSSMHKDHYENIYAVLQGEKHFTLIPPAYYPFLFEGMYINRKWKCKESAIKFDTKMEFYVEAEKTGEENFVDWITINTDSERDIHSFGLPELLSGEELKSYHVILEQGDVLYLPSLWYHQVSQYHENDGYINAVNFWWDMDYSKGFPMISMLKGLMPK